MRPTMEPLRDLMMFHLGPLVVGARVLDLFAGTGAIGLEALSRGARSVDFVENGTSAMHALKGNVAKVKARERTRIFERDAIPYAEMLSVGSYDIAFVDPPYGSKKLDRVVARWQQVAFAKTLVVEYAADHGLVIKGKTFRLEDSLVTICSS